jgi:hypothetical protein
VLLYEVSLLTGADYNSPGSQPFDHVSSGSSPRVGNKTACPQTRHPLLYQKYKQALRNFIDNLPSEHRDPIQRVSGRKQIKPDVLDLVSRYRFHRLTKWLLISTHQHLHIAVVDMWLEDRDCWEVENTAANKAARRILGLARIVPEEQMAELDLYTCMLLTWAARVLIKELKRLATVSQDYLGKRSSRIHAVKSC